MGILHQNVKKTPLDLYNALRLH